MKRCWFGAGLLILLLSAGLFVTAAMARIYEPMAQELEQAAQYAQESDWDQALDLTAKARQRWETCRNFSAAFADHAPMDEIDRLFAELEVWTRMREPRHCASVCLQLSRAAQSMTDAHAITWWNLL